MYCQDKKFPIKTLIILIVIFSEIIKSE